LSSTRRAFLQSLSRSAIVLPLEKVLALALPKKRMPGVLSQGAASPRTAAVAPPNDLGISFLNVARESGLNAKTIYGGEHKNKYLLETTGCGVAFYDYDNDGWLDIFVVNGWRLEGFPAGQEPTNHLFKNNRDGTTMTASTISSSPISGKTFSITTMATARSPTSAKKLVSPETASAGTPAVPSWTTIATATSISSSPTTSIST
jgi:hypothetical protein